MSVAADLTSLRARYQSIATSIYPHRCSIQRVSELDDGRGGWSESWSLVETGIACAYVPYPTGQRELVIAGQPKGMCDGDVWLPALFNSEELDVTEKDRIIIAALGSEPERILEIVFPSPHQGILIQAHVRQIAQPATTSLQTQFFYNDLSPLSLGVVTANKVIRSITVHIQEEFDDTSSLSAGVTGDEDSLMDETYINTELVETFKVQPNVSFGSDTEIFLTITPGGSTQGSGYVEVEVDA